MGIKGCMYPIRLNAHMAHPWLNMSTASTQQSNFYSRYFTEGTARGRPCSPTPDVSVFASVFLRPRCAAWKTFRRFGMMGRRARSRAFTLARRRREPMPAARPTLREWLSEMPFAMGLSAGFFGFFAHAGVVTVLEDHAPLPSRVSGASAGALVAGAWASGLTAAAFARELLALRRHDFWDPALGLGLLKGELFRARLAAILPVQRFEQCRMPLSVSVYDIASRTTFAAHEGELVPAITASCTLPVLFQPARLNGRAVLDGGIVDRHGLLGMPKDERLFYHHLVSRSPWRRANSPALDIPSRAERASMTALLIDDLPRAGPFRLEQGEKAFLAAQRAMREALDRPVDDRAVRLSAKA